MPEPVIWHTDCRLSILQGDLSYQYVEIPGHGSLAGAEPLVVIALHGWLDNSASFTPLIEHLLGRNTHQATPPLRIYMLDFAGHGYSFHRPVGCTYPIWDYGLDVAQFILALDLPAVTLLGHSMGACVAPIVAHILTEQVTAIFAIEALGPIANEITDTAQQFSGVIERQQQQQQRPLKLIPSFKQAVVMRMQGMFKLSEAAATLLVERNLKKVTGGYQWRSDRRLTLPSPVRFCEQQVCNLLTELTVPVTLITGDRLQQDKRIEQRVACVSNMVLLPLSGGHHLHMEEQVAATADAFYELLQRQRSCNRDRR